jgi:ATP-dependent DNA helicase RecQ
MKKKLLELRETLIKKYDYAEFFIYTDEQLDRLIEHQPKTKAEFIKVKGFGEKKYTNFGKEVIRLFKTYKLK